MRGRAQRGRAQTMDLADVVDDALQVVVEFIGGKSVIQLRATSRNLRSKTHPLITALHLGDPTTRWSARSKLKEGVLEPLGTFDQKAFLPFCSGLKWLRLRGGGFEKLDGRRSRVGISSFSALTTLHLESSDIRDIGPLASCPSLAEVHLGWLKKLTDISPLADCAALTHLALHQCFALADISPIAACTGLQKFSSAGSKAISDFSPLASCTAMTTLRISRSAMLPDELKDFSWIASCAALTELILVDTFFGLADLSLLASCTALESIDLSGCCEIYRIEGETPDDYEYQEPEFENEAHDRIDALFEQLPRLAVVYTPEGGAIRAVPGADPVYEPPEPDSDCDRFDY